MYVPIPNQLVQDEQLVWDKTLPTVTVVEALCVSITKVTKHLRACVNNITWVTSLSYASSFLRWG